MISVRPSGASLKSVPDRNPDEARGGSPSYHARFRLSTLASERTSNAGTAIESRSRCCRETGVFPPSGVAAGGCPPRVGSCSTQGCQGLFRNLVSHPGRLRNCSGQATSQVHAGARPSPGAKRGSGSYGRSIGPPTSIAHACRVAPLRGLPRYIAHRAARTPSTLGIGHWTLFVSSSRNPVSKLPHKSRSTPPA